MWPAGTLDDPLEEGAATSSVMAKGAPVRATTTKQPSRVLWSSWARRSRIGVTRRCRARKPTDSRVSSRHWAPGLADANVNTAASACGGVGRE